MDEKQLYSITGIFNTADEISAAAREIAGAGYKHYDINTPYPVHGLGNLMKLRHSPLGYFALAFGLTGTSIALFFMFWSESVNYRIVIGGKPFFALPAYIPITFEVTVLLASVLTAVVMLFIFFKLPNNSHPLHDTDYIRKVSTDKFGVNIESRDKNFDEHRVVSFLESLGAQDITRIYYDNETLNARIRIFDFKFISFLVIAALLTSLLTYLTLNKLLFIEPFTWMANQPRQAAQEASEFFSDGFGMRTPVEGTIARNFIPYPFPDKADSAAEVMTNPLAVTQENIELGKEKFGIYCSPCHGWHAEGDSHLRGQFPSPPTLHSDKVRNWKDGRIYHVITMGQNIMPSYAKQVTRDERWAIILYIRTLQRAMDAKEGDLK